jgi:NTP pyrophosphatase (non-canonical NTP hydrolase)
MKIEDYGKWRPTYSKYECKDKDRGPCNPAAEFSPHKTASIVGLAAEAGELLGLVQKAIRKRVPLDRMKVIDELGDVFWYMNYVMDAHGITFDELTDFNKKKLDDRNK